MAIDPLPTDFPFLWATTGTVTVPPGGDQLSGWTFEQAPPYDWFNWLGWGSGQGLKYLKSYLDQEHSDVAGKHTKVTYAAVRSVVIPLGRPDVGGWIAVDGTLSAPVYNYAATPPNTGLAAGTGAIYLHRDVPLIIGPDDAAAADQWVISSLKITYKCVSRAGNFLQWALYSALADGSGAPVLEKSNVLAASTPWIVATASCAAPTNPTVDPARRYYVRIHMQYDAAAAAGEVAFSNVDVVCTRAKIE
jgi:hypothetical protein